MARKINFCSADGDGDDHIIATRNATGSTLDSVKNGLKKTYESSKDGFQQVRQWVSDKLAS